MNSTLRNFFEALKGADAGTKVVMAVASAAMIGTMAIVGMMSKDEHYVPAFVDVPAADMPAVTKALADAGISMEVRSSDVGTAVFVPRSSRDAANMAVYSGGAIRSHAKGILNGDTGGLSVFAGSDERRQWTRAKEMEEVEAMLESTSYVDKAEGYKRQVVTSGLRNTTSESASLIVTTVGGMELTNGQKQAISQAFGSALGLTPEEYSIYDQEGRAIHGGGDDAGGAFDDRVLELQRDYNRSLERSINSHLAQVHGPGKALVLIHSEFDTTQSTEVTQEAGDPVELTSKLYSVENPSGAISNPDGGGVAGASSNVADANAWGVDSTAVVTGTGEASMDMATTEERESTSFVPTTTRTKVHNQPILKRLSIALTLDSSLVSEDNPDPLADLDESVKAMAGFDKDRGDTFVSSIQTFVVPEVSEDGEAEEAASGGFDLNMILERGVEIIVALAFVILLLKGLKGAKSSAQEAEAGELTLASGAVVGPDGEVTETEIDPEVLARAQVENLVSNNPERVAQILSNWVIEDRSAVKS